jgi:16S rRNA (adenine1518-N6/adenine1519-N6)-dimethyltransferase
MKRQINIKKILRNSKLAPSKQRGQNFLVNPATAEAIVSRAGVCEEDTIVELGVGLGSLTIPLAAKAKEVIGIELDNGIISWHQEEKILPTNVSILHQDLLKADFNEIAGTSGAPLKIIANLPYSISNPLLFKLIENRESMDYAVLMLQKEVGQRLRASPGTKEYGVLSVLLGAYASVEVLMEVGPGQFHPRPKVDSVVVKIVFRQVNKGHHVLPDHDYRLLKRVVNAAFQQRRKTLLNSLSAANIPGASKQNLLQILPMIGIDPKIRPERLTVEDFIKLSNAI